MTDMKPSRFALLWAWLSVDNVTLFIGVASVTTGASMFSARAGFLACGALLIGLTVTQSILDVKLRLRPR